MTRCVSYFVPFVLLGALSACSDNTGGGSPGSDTPQLPPSPTVTQQPLFQTPSTTP